MLADKASSYYKLQEKKITRTRRFNSENPGACFQCPTCNYVWSVTHKQGVDWLLNYCPSCGADIKNEKIEADIANEIMKLKPKASILFYDKL